MGYTSEIFQYCTVIFVLRRTILRFLVCLFDGFDFREITCLVQIVIYL